MRISRSGRTGDIFGEELEKKLAKKMPGSDKHIDQRLDEHRDIRGHEHKLGTEEVILAGDRKHDKTIGQQLTEENLRDHGADEDVDVITEKQLNDAPKSKGSYPQRNAKAHERTGDKRPVNALDEELGNAGDESKVNRYEKANTSGRKRLLDKDVGTQLTNEKTKIKNAFNLKEQKTASLEKVAGDYLTYRTDNKVYNRKFAQVAELDAEMSKIMKVASSEGRGLSDDEQNLIAELKTQKSKLLGISEDQ